MRRWLTLVMVAAGLISLTTQSSFARPPDARDGANHHVGDDSFVAAFGRPPDPGDSEELRMHTHLAYIHDWLASRPATRPELAATRAQILGYLDEYVAHGTTPRNAHLQWRNPVFIDDAGTICAVGYLIARSAGRPLAERIAAAHRYDYIEDIAAAMPEVSDWVAGSGFTLDEIASIQPGYSAEISSYHPWDHKADRPADGAFASANTGMQGTIRGGQMEGAWTRVVDGKVVGSGTFVHGKGTWRSTYPDGRVMAGGAYAGDVPHGAWRFYHPSGALAAEGRFSHGWRHGSWSFYQDSPKKILISAGQFAHGDFAGEWKHYDQEGKLLAVSRPAVPAEWTWHEAFLLDVIPGADGIRHQIHQGSATGDYYRLDAIAGAERLYVWSRAPGIFDADGHQLQRSADGWRAHDCHWTAKMKALAHAGDLPRLHAELRGGNSGGFDETCGDAEETISVARGRRIDAMLASVEAVRAPTPAFVRDLARGQGVQGASSDQDPPSIFDEITHGSGAEDMAKVLARSMTWYIEWPQVDRRFIAVMGSIPGYIETQN